jgi:uncharacterized cupin superfamily protein
MTSSPPAISLADALLVSLPESTLKPTSLDGQFESSQMLWESSDGLLELGVWECTPGTFTAFRDGYDEIAQVVHGRATIVGDDGSARDISPGSTLIQPNGWRGTWTIHETLRKVYVIRVVSTL